MLVKRDPSPEEASASDSTTESTSSSPAGAQGQTETPGNTQTILSISPAETGALPPTTIEARKPHKGKRGRLIGTVATASATVIAATAYFTTRNGQETNQSIPDLRSPVTTSAPAMPGQRTEAPTTKPAPAETTHRPETVTTPEKPALDAKYLVTTAEHSSVDGAVRAIFAQVEAYTEGGNAEKVNSGEEPPKAGDPRYLEGIFGPAEQRPPRIAETAAILENASKATSLQKALAVYEHKGDRYDLRFDVTDVKTMLVSGNRITVKVGYTRSSNAAKLGIIADVSQLDALDYKVSAQMTLVQEGGTWRVIDWFDTSSQHLSAKAT